MLKAVTTTSFPLQLINRRKVLQVESAFADTFVLLCQQGSGSKTILHIDGNGHVLHQYSNENITCFTMVSDREAVVPLPQSNFIKVFHLKDGGTGYVNFPFTIQKEEGKGDLPDKVQQYSVSETKVQFFEETKILCFETKREKLFNGDISPLTGQVRKGRKEVKVAYMKTPIVPEVLAEKVIGDIPYPHIKKVDNSSSIVVFDSGRREFRLICLKDSKIQSTQIVKQEQNSFNLYIQPLFTRPMKENTFIRRINSTEFVFLTYTHGSATKLYFHSTINIETDLIHRHVFSDNQNSNRYFTQNSIITVQRREERPRSLEKKSSFCGRPLQTYWEVTFFDFEMKQTGCVRVQSQFSLLKPHESSYQPAFLFWNDDTFDKPEAMLQVTKIESLRFKDVFMLMLQHLNEDFDDDLLYDCICLLGQEE